VLISGPFGQRCEAFSRSNFACFLRSWSRKTSVFDARYQGIAKIEYPLHPLFGREGRVVRLVRYGLLTCLELEIDQKIVNVARWMTRADLCTSFTCGHNPQPDLDALVQILTLIDQA
jgi:hypothetical protein